MPNYHGCQFLFCKRCGTRLTRISQKLARCPHPNCDFKCDAKEIMGRELCYTVSGEDIRRELQIKPFDEEIDVVIEEVHGQSANKECPQCKNPKLRYHTKQIRSADEGMTVFYVCPKCGHKFCENT